MSLNDLFSKFELTIDGSCKRIEKIAFDLFNEVQGNAEEKGDKPQFELKISQQARPGADPVQISIEQYLQSF